MVLWVVIANSSFAEIFEVKGRGKEIKKLERLDNPEGRAKGADILADRPGRSSEGPQGGSTRRRHALGTETDVHLQEITRFAHELIEILQKAQKNSFDQLALIAAPQLLGVLRGLLNNSLKEKVTKEIDKDFNASLSDPEKIEAICRLLDLERPVYTPTR
jgi:protein required for attachment to host cells